MCQFSDEFVEVMKKTTLNQRIPFDMNGGFVKLYFGKEKKRVVSYAEFSQFLHVCSCLINLPRRK
jgi:solute carrier family 25 (mitochondrial aspartate/glutamate transporter), member 12/13